MSLAHRSVQVTRHTLAARHGARARGPDHRTGQRHAAMQSPLTTPAKARTVSCGYSCGPSREGEIPESKVAGVAGVADDLAKMKNGSHAEDVAASLACLIGTNLQIHLGG